MTVRGRRCDSSVPDFGGMISREEEPTTLARATCGVGAPQTTAARARYGDLLSVSVLVLAGETSAWTPLTTSPPNSDSPATAPRFGRCSILPTRKKRASALAARSSSQTERVRLLPLVQGSSLSSSSSRPRSGSFRALCAQSGAVPTSRRSTPSAHLELLAAAVELKSTKWAKRRDGDGPAVRSSSSSSP